MIRPPSFACDGPMRRIRRNETLPRRLRVSGKFLVDRPMHDANPNVDQPAQLTLPPAKLNLSRVSNH